MLSEQQKLTKRQYMTVDNAIEHAGFGLAQIRYMLAAGVVFFTEVQLAVSGSLLLPSIKCTWSLEKWEVLLLLMSGAIAFTLGGLVGGIIADKYGRRRNVIYGQFLQILFTAISLVQTNFYLFVAARSAAHFFFMIIKPSATCMTLEVCPRRTRYLAKLFLALSGQLGAATSALLVMKYLGHYGWRDLKFMLTIPCFVPLFLYVLLDESPRYLLLSGHPEKGAEVISKIYRLNKKEDLTHLIKNRKDPNRGQISEMFTPEFESTTWIIMIIFLLKNFIISTLHTAMPFLFQGEYCGVEGNTSQNGTSLQICHDLSSKRIDNLMKGYFIGIVVIIGAVSLSQVIGRKRASIFCYLLAAGALFSNAFCQGKDLLVFKFSAALSFHHGATAIMTLFIQEIYPTSIRAMTTGFFFSMGHVISLAAPFITVYVLTGREQEFFLAGGFVFVFCSILLKRVKHESVNEPLRESTKEYYREDSDWDAELDYDQL